MSDEALVTVVHEFIFGFGRAPPFTRRSKQRGPLPGGAFRNACDAVTMQSDDAFLLKEEKTAEPEVAFCLYLWYNIAT